MGCFRIAQTVTQVEERALSSDAESASVSCHCLREARSVFPALSRSREGLSHGFYFGNDERTTARETNFTGRFAQVFVASDELWLVVSGHDSGADLMPALA